jgi:hypothetical protein
MARRSRTITIWYPERIHHCRRCSSCVSPNPTPHITMADEKNKKPLTMEELRAKVEKIVATVLPVLHPDLQRIVDEQ